MDLLVKVPGGFRWNSNANYARVQILGAENVKHINAFSPR